ncbi:MAG TPA: CbtA family protein [Steroidobacteraceae bacterium]|nr:CbtA family protein [Steroidobacteraceae bacterium]
MSALIARGLIVGIVAGLLAFAFAKTFGEPAVAVAINFESAQDEAERAAAIAAHEHVQPEEPEMFSRTIQTGIGLFTGIVGIGLGIGGLFAILFAFANGRIARLGPGATATLVAALCLITFYIIPALKYPANPPSVGHPDTIRLRTGLYFLMMALSVASTIGAVLYREKLQPRLGTWGSSVVVFLLYVIVIAVIYTALPSINEVPATFPAVTLWNFRIASLGIQIVLWGATGLMFGYLAQREARSLTNGAANRTATRSE